MSEVKVNVTAEDGATISILEGQANTPFDYKGFQLTVSDLASLIEMAHTYGCDELSLVMVGEKGVLLIVDNKEYARPKDTVYYPYRPQLAYKAWGEKLKSKIDYRKFIEFLRGRNPEEVEGMEILLAKLTTIKFDSIVNGDYSYDDNNNMTVMFKTSTSEGSQTLPKQIIASLPIFEDQPVYRFALDMELILPKSEQEKPSFILTCPRWDENVIAAQRDILVRTKKDLAGYTILSGDK
jgi:hypothetical protein